jgi:hypothetical protein
MEATHMKSMTALGTIALLLLFGLTVPAGAQKEQEPKQEKQQQEAKPQKEQQAKPEKQQQPAKPERQQQQKQQQQQAKDQQQQQRQQQAKGQQQDQQKQQQQQAKDQQQQQRQQQAKTQQQDQQKQQQQARTQQGQQHQQEARRQSPQEQHAQAHEQQASWQQNRAHNWQSEHRDWRQRGGYNGYRIPDDRYRGYFGESHGFRIYSEPVVLYGGSPRFQYGGFWFGFVDPWPEYWSNDWYESDEVYVIYSDNGYYMYNRRYPRDRIAISVYVN